MLGRPDLHGGGDPRPLALEQHASIARLMALPDHVVVYPSHYGGSVCGRGLSGNPISSIGFERAHNRALLQSDAEAFADALLEDLPRRRPTRRRSWRRIAPARPSPADARSSLLGR